MQPYKEIALVNGGIALVDENDYERVSKYRWFRSANGYAHRQGWSGGKHWAVFLHREINSTPPHLFTDHINGNKLDNRRSNLRTCNKAQNAANTAKLRRELASSQLKGVSFHPASGLWRARVRDGGWQRTTYHKTEQQAALDYNRMAAERFGEFAQVNQLPDGITPTPIRRKSSRFRGVTFHKRSMRWRAALEKDRRAIHLGAFQSELEAAKCYNDGALKHFGSNAKLNVL